MFRLVQRFTQRDTHTVIGLMSGTSVDGVDAAVCRISGHGRGNLKLRVVGEHSEPFDPQIRERILALCKTGGGSTAEICELNFILGDVFAQAALNAAQAAELPLTEIDLIGSHGQTIAHFPPGATHTGIRRASTLQIGEAAIIAEKTGVPVVSNFRPRDMAAGGQGAPLVPFADWLIFSSQTENRLALNIGGIANVTWMPASTSPDGVVAFDTGPGNMILDALAEKISGGKLAYDHGGNLARSGKVDATLLNELLAHPYFHRAPPKSTGREEFGNDFAMTVYEKGVARILSGNDILATATMLTARSIADSITTLAGNHPSATALKFKVLAAGGGVRNDCLMEMLRNALGNIEFELSERFGVPTQFRECAAFAILARETMLGRPSNLPAATGARGPRILGDITP
jgi:anhydro-N-acetylmuramic acid kinase